MVYVECICLVALFIDCVPVCIPPIALLCSVYTWLYCIVVLYRCLAAYVQLYLERSTSRIMICICWIIMVSGIAVEISLSFISCDSVVCWVNGKYSILYDLTFEFLIPKHTPDNIQCFPW